jgi:hypothetical protein
MCNVIVGKAGEIPKDSLSISHKNFGQNVAQMDTVSNPTCTVEESIICQGLVT